MAISWRFADWPLRMKMTSLVAASLIALVILLTSTFGSTMRGHWMA